MDSYTNQGSASVVLRVRLENRPGTLARLTGVIGQTRANIGAIDLVSAEGDALVRDLTLYLSGSGALERLLGQLEALDGIEVISVADRTFQMHAGGKIEVVSKVPVRTRDQLSMAYTPGVARVCMAIHDEPEQAFTLTSKANMVAVVSDGTAVLGLGDIGPYAAMPVMEGKAQLFKEFGGVNAFPICLDTHDVDEIVETVTRIAPGFGGINLEDISAPRCFEIERRLKADLDIPVFHDDQHGTAVVSTAALINALRVVGKKPEDLKVVVMGVGAAGTAVSRMFINLGVKNLIGVDRKGVISRNRPDLTPEKALFASFTNPHDEQGSVHDAMTDADVFVGLSGPNLIDEHDLEKMAARPIVFALSNPDPEIAPEKAYGRVAVMATGRSDYPNQINNVLCFPGIFKGALACRATDINEEMKLAAAHAIAACIDADHLTADYIIPSVFDQSVADRVAEAVERAAVQTGVARAAVR